MGYHDVDTGNNGGAYRHDDVDIQPCTDGAACYNVGWIVPEEWLAYDVNVSASASYVFTFRVATPNDDGSFHVEVDGVDVTGTIHVPNTGGWSSFRNVRSKAIDLTAGRHTVKLVADADYFNLNYINVKPSTP